MKKVLFIISLFLPIYALYAEEESVFPTSDAIWNIQIDGKEYYYGLVGDSLIDNMLYHKLYLLHDTIPNEAAVDEYVGAIRVKEKQVWFRPGMVGSAYEYGFDVLLYDFSVNTGDEIYHNGMIDGAPQSPNPYFIQCINEPVSRIIDVVDKDGFKIYDCYLEDFMAGGRNVWIEGIGSSKGLFFFLFKQSMGGDVSHNLLCFKQKDKVLYLQPECKECFEGYGTTYIQDKADRIDVKLWCDGGYLYLSRCDFPAKIRLFNLMGQLCFEKDILPNTQQMLLENNVNPGTYLYQLEADSGVVKSGKLIIKR